MVHRDSARRLVRSRLGLAAGVSVVAFFALVAVGSHVFDGMMRWLHAQPSYQTSIASIVLDPPPPGWYRGGATAFRERLRRETHRGAEAFSALDLDLGELLREFKLDCWVKRAVLAEHKSPNRIIVHLEYRTPVARSAVDGKRGVLLLDEEAVILPFDEVEDEHVAGLIRLEWFDPPFEPLPGRVWKLDDSAERLGKADGRVLAAVKLAAWLKTALDREPKPVPPGLRVVAIYRDVQNAVWLENADKTMIYWPPPPAYETQGQRTAAQRWDDLRLWLRRRGATAAPGLSPLYLDFTPEGVLIKKGKGPHG